ncbi:MAG: thiol-disulfide isomerase [Bacteroidetes bacterium]|nr:thiol-disulfide isomerase [Bacteroidota bacterium]
MKRKTEETKISTNAFEKLVNSSEKGSYILRLYVTGSTPQSMRAIQNIKTICEENLKERYQLEIINLYENPDAARTEQIIAAPTLIKSLPLPLRRIIGDLSDFDKVLVGMGIVK